MVGCTTSALVCTSCTRSVQENNAIGLVINHRISAEWSTTKKIAIFSCTPRVQRVNTKSVVVDLIPGLLGLWVLFSYHA